MNTDASIQILIENLFGFLHSTTTDTRLAARFRRPVAFHDFKAIAKDHGYDLAELKAADAERQIRGAVTQTRALLHPDEIAVLGRAGSRLHAAIETLQTAYHDGMLEFCRDWQGDP